jgi:hypothetical protein
MSQEKFANAEFRHRAKCLKLLISVIGWCERETEPTGSPPDPKFAVTGESII